MPLDPALVAEVRAWLAKAGSDLRAGAVELGEACVAIDASLEPLLRDAAELTEYAWRFRYPGDFDEPAASEADQALRVGNMSALSALQPGPVCPL